MVVITFSYSVNGVFLVKRIVRFLFLFLAVAHLSLHSSLNNIVCKHDGQDVYFSQVDSYPQYKDTFIEYAQKHICDDSLDMVGLQWLAYKYQDEIAPIVNAIVKHIKGATIQVATLERIHAYLFPYAPLAQKQKIEQAAKKKWPKQLDAKIDMKNILSTGQSAAITPSFLPYVTSFKGVHGTQTEQQACKYLSKIIVLLAQYNIKDQKPSVKKMFLAAFTKEVQEFKKGNYVFWHGRNYAWDYCAYLYKQFYNLDKVLAHKVGNDYTFLRFDDSTSRWGAVSVPDALYMNAYLFGNVNCWGHSTIQLVLSNDDFSKKLIDTFTAQYICAQFSYEKYYQKYKADFEKLEQLHQEASQEIGNLLMICIDEKNINRVYSAGDWADEKVPITLSNGQSTTEVKKIIDDLRTGKLTDFDHLQCVLPLTKDYALDPKKSPRIYSFNATDPAKQKEFEAFGTQLFAKIAADIKKQVST